VDEVRVYAPGSISNLGPGFDCLGAAFTGRGDTVTARRSSVPGVRVTSVSDARIPTDAARNLRLSAAVAGNPAAVAASGDILTLPGGSDNAVALAEQTILEALA